MKLDTVLARLRAHEAELRESGVEALSVFGSVARGDNSDDSDVDIAAKLRPGTWRGLTGLVRLKRKLETLIDGEVDVFEFPVRKPRLADDIERDRVVAFE